MADQNIDTLVENLFASLSHLGIDILELLVAPLEEAKGVEEFALRDEFNEQLVSHLMRDGR